MIYIGQGGSTFVMCAPTACKSRQSSMVLTALILRHLSAHNGKGRSTDDLAFLTESWSSSFRDFGETFAVGLAISKVFNRVWLKSLISKLPSYGFYPSFHLQFLF